MTGRAAITGALLLAAAPASAHEPAATTTPPAEGAALVVRWSAPSECPEEEALVQRIAALLPGATGQGVTAEVDVRREPTGLRGSLVLQTPWGSTTRMLEAERSVRWRSSRSRWRRPTATCGRC
jgi:hypothetical protein